MTQVSTFTATTAGTVIKAGNGVIRNVNITKAGSSDTAITIYDNASAASGPVLYVGGGAVTGSFALDQETGVNATHGAYIVISATVAPNVCVYYT